MWPKHPAIDIVYNISYNICCIDGLFVRFLNDACKLSCSENVNYRCMMFMVEFHVTVLPDYCTV